MQLDPDTQYFPSIEDISAKARVESQIDPVSSKTSHDKEELPDDCDIPTSILEWVWFNPFFFLLCNRFWRLFPDLSTEEIAGILLTFQNKEEEIWNKIDTKYKNKPQRFKRKLYKKSFASYCMCY